MHMAQGKPIERDLKIAPHISMGPSLGAVSKRHFTKCLCDRVLANFLFLERPTKDPGHLTK